MKGVLAVLTHKEQALVGAVLLAGMSTQGAGLAGIMRIDVDCHAVVQERFVGSSDLTGNATGHLGGKMKPLTHISIRSILQADFVAHLTMREGVTRHKVQAITVC